MSTIDAVEILPCPHCGPGESVVEAWQDDYGYWRVSCGRCGSSSGTVPGKDTAINRERYPNPRASVIATWNTRIPATPQPSIKGDTAEVVAWLNKAAASAESMASYASLPEAQRMWATDAVKCRRAVSLIEAQEAEIERQRTLIVEMQQWLDAHNKRFEAVEAELTAARAAIAEARDRALEEAAQWHDVKAQECEALFTANNNHTMALFIKRIHKDSAAAIRALRPSPAGEQGDAKSVYLAARYSRAPELRQYRTDLAQRGYLVTSRWIDGGHELTKEGSTEAAHNERARFASEDMGDLLKADIVISFTEEPRKTTTRGGRHVEHGMALSTGKRVIVVGHRENVFHCLPQVEFFENWNEALCALTPPPSPKGGE